MKLKRTTIYLHGFGLADLEWFFIWKWPKLTDLHEKKKKNIILFARILFSDFNAKTIILNPVLLLINLKFSQYHNFELISQI